MAVHSPYLKKLFRVDSHAKLVQSTLDAIHQDAVSFNAVAVTGSSGMLVGAPVAYALGKPIILVRSMLSAHSPQRVEGDFSAKRYVIVDDFVESGTTVRRILRAIKEVMPKSECVGIYLYDQTKTHSENLSEAFHTPVKCFVGVRKKGVSRESCGASC